MPQDDAQHSAFGRYPLEKALLGLLLPGPKHGYVLYQNFLSTFQKIWKAGQTKVYVTLTALEKQGYLTITTEAQERRPARKIYHLTEAGRAEFLTWLHQPVPSMRAVRVEFLAKLRLFALLRLPGASALIASQLALFETILDEWTGQADSPEGDQSFSELVREFQIQQMHFLINWLGSVQERHEDLFEIAPR
jgi:DNA-binding PadR family transcriptional regulator